MSNAFLRRALPLATLLVSLILGLNSFADQPKVNTKRLAADTKNALEKMNPSSKAALEASPVKLEAVKTRLQRNHEFNAFCGLAESYWSHQRRKKLKAGEPLTNDDLKYRSPRDKKFVEFTKTLADKVLRSYSPDKKGAKQIEVMVSRCSILHPKIARKAKDDVLAANQKLRADLSKLGLTDYSNFENLAKSVQPQAIAQTQVGKSRIYDNNRSADQKFNRPTEDNPVISDSTRAGSTEGITAGTWSYSSVFVSFDQDSYIDSLDDGFGDPMYWDSLFSPSTTSDRIEAHFDFVDLEDGYDYVYLYDDFGVCDQITGTAFDFYSYMCVGNFVDVYVYTDFSNSGLAGYTGFYIDSFNYRDGTNSSPIADGYSFDTTLVAGGASTQVYNDSYDPDASTVANQINDGIVDYEWTVTNLDNGDFQVYTGTWEPLIFFDQITAGEVGFYEIELWVQDEDGATALSYDYVEVISSNQIPNARLAVSTDPGGNAVAGQTVSFDACASWDDDTGDNSLLEFLWDMDDGYGKFTTGIGPSACLYNHVFDAPGLYFIESEVSDGELSDFSFRTIDVTCPPVPVDPTIQLSKNAGAVDGVRISWSSDPNAALYAVKSSPIPGTPTQGSFSEIGTTGGSSYDPSASVDGPRGSFFLVSGENACGQQSQRPPAP